MGHVQLKVTNTALTRAKPFYRNLLAWRSTPASETGSSASA
ncbi:hypothetical protein [Streptosporangium saharense]